MRKLTKTLSALLFVMALSLMVFQSSCNNEGGEKKENATEENVSQPADENGGDHMMDEGMEHEHMDEGMEHEHMDEGMEHMEEHPAGEEHPSGDDHEHPEGE